MEPGFVNLTFGFSVSTCTVSITLPCESMPPGVRKITRVGNQAGVDFLLFEPQNPVQKEFITENPVKVKVRGEYHELGIFLSKVANLDRIVNVSNLVVKAADKKDAGGGGEQRVVRNYTIEAEMILTAYTLVEGGETNNGKATQSSPNQSTPKVNTKTNGATDNNS